MSWALLAWLSGALTALAMAWLGWLFWTDPPRGFEVTTHRPELLPRVMGDRYGTIALLTLLALISGNLFVLAGLFAALVCMGTADTWLHAQAGYRYSRHLVVTLAGVLALGVTLIAAFQKGS